MMDKTVKLKRGRTKTELWVARSSMTALRFSGWPAGTRLISAFWGARNLFPFVGVIALDDLDGGRCVFRPTPYDVTVGYMLDGSPYMALQLVFDASASGHVGVTSECHGAKLPMGHPERSDNL